MMIWKALPLPRQDKLVLTSCPKIFLLNHQICNILLQSRQGEYFFQPHWKNLSQKVHPEIYKDLEAQTQRKSVSLEQGMGPFLIGIFTNIIEAEMKGPLF